MTCWQLETKPLLKIGCLITFCHDSQSASNEDAASEDAAAAALGINASDDMTFPMVVMRYQDYNMTLHKAPRDLAVVMQLHVRLKDS